MRVRLVAAFVVAFALAAPASAVAAAGCPKTSASDIADEVMCLQCGVPLNLAEDAPSAKRERAFIQTLVEQCRSKGQIKTALVAQFGPHVLADPKSKATWLVPALAFGAAVVALGFGAFRWRRRRRAGATGADPAAAAAAPAPAPAGDAARLQADIDSYDL
ncbi:MAG: cytochrome c-type biosis protein CcmH [Thermoleophilaceae bacterium]|nr:cytochrome c-type biosis protein CcmH [Thermoleophilaceae bacterium]